ncbi:MAG: HPF/RaiA family ribosome-associated protein [Burkholderiaceae bacterium]|nr:HPF/RaiA family ribosome-associated protein [Burkholderiaceae bacterium]
MQLIFETRDPQAARWRDMAERRLRFVIRRLQWLVPQARIRLSDVNGPRGGVDKRCQVELHAAGAGTVVVTAVATHWPAALDRALARAGRALLRALRRARQQRASDLPVAV